MSNETPTEERWRARLTRNLSARKEAERLLEAKSIELYEANEKLRELADALEARVQERTRQLEEREQTFTMLFEHSLDGIILHGVDGRIHEANKEAVRLLGFPIEKLREMSITDLHPEDELPMSKKASQVVKEQGFARFECRFRRCDRSTFAAEVSASRFDHGGRPMVQEIIRDITERNRVQAELEEAKEEAERANAAKSLFLANMSHEIRTPMNGIIGVAELLAPTGLSADQQDLVATIQRSGESLLEIINDILDISKIESGKLEIESVEFSLSECLERAWATVMPEAARKGLNLVCKIDPTTADQIIGDPIRLRQIISNLLSNAVKFTEEGEVVLTACSSASGPSRAHFEFEISDTGIGISPSDLPKLFENFSQVDSSTTRHYGGTGLGLAICKRLCDIQGGQIEVESDPGTETTFKVSLEFGLGIESSDTPPPASRFEGRHALVAASSPSQFENLSHLCSHLGCTVERYPITGSGAPESAASSDYDIVILDLDLPTARAAAQTLGSKGCPVVKIDSLHGEAADLSESSDEFAAKLFEPVLLRKLASACAVAFGEQTEDTDAPPAPATSPTRSLRVLVAEDNPINRRVVVKMLKRLGHEATTAHDGREVLAMLRDPAADDFDLVLMDLQMPLLDGVETTRAIRADKSIEDSLPIIALTADALRDERDRCLAAGMNGFLTKPLRVAELERALAAGAG